MKLFEKKETEAQEGAQAPPREPKQKQPRPKKERKPIVLSHELIILAIFLTFLAVMTIIGIAYDDEFFGAATDYDPGSIDNKYLDWTNQQIPHIIRSCQILFVAAILFIGLKFLQRFIGDKTSFRTAAKLMISFTRYAIFIIAILFILTAWGADTRTLLVSAGILGLIIGLGAQSLIADIIAGMFIVFDGEYKVGDVIVVNSWRGTVEEIGIRTTKIVDTGGNIKYINNSHISEVINKSQDLSLVSSTLCIPYEANLIETELKIKEYIPKIMQREPIFVEGPFYKGVEAMSASSVDLMFHALCKEEDYFPARRALNREVYIMANEIGINIPFDQLVVHMDNSERGEFSNSARTQKKADVFVKEQQEASKDIEASND
ncbi:Small-conductance mechanosensitive channel [Thermoplasmatales archaeon BRNA1]|nr:Small-conductance mechanosensitive channel [Thermoplasmatales archaeon BRNA1]